MCALITEVVASAVALRGRSRRGVGVLLSLESPRGRQAARCSSGLQSEEEEEEEEVTCTSENTWQLSGGTSLIICSLKSVNPALRSTRLSSSVTSLNRDARSSELKKRLKISFIQLSLQKKCRQCFCNTAFLWVT